MMRSPRVRRMINVVYSTSERFRTYWHGVTSCCRHLVLDTGTTHVEMTSSETPLSRSQRRWLVGTNNWLPPSPPPPVPTPTIIHQPHYYVIFTPMTSSPLMTSFLTSLHTMYKPRIFNTRDHYLTDVFVHWFFTFYAFAVYQPSGGILSPGCLSRP